VSDAELILIVTAAVLALALAPATWRTLRNRLLRDAPQAVIVDSRSSTSHDWSTGSVRSVQTAEVLMAADALEAIWSATNLERLARTYWRFLSRVTAGLLHVSYSSRAGSARARSVVLLAPPLALITFHEPEYELDRSRGLVRWRISGGLLVARRGRAGQGYLQIEVRRVQGSEDGRARLIVEVSVCNFYPSIASGISRRIYDATQSRIHVIVTNAFLRSLVRLDLAESRVRRFSARSA
jgi:hypothetical protein